MLTINPERLVLVTAVSDCITHLEWYLSASVFKNPKLLSFIHGLTLVLLFPCPIGSEMMILIYLFQAPFHL